MIELILNQIKEKMEEICANVFYGMVDESFQETIWEYIVFNRVATVPSANKTSYSDTFAIHYIHENYIPEGVFEDIVEKMCSIDGMRIDGDATYTYVQKPNTNAVVEMLSIQFVKPRKKVVK